MRTGGDDALVEVHRLGAAVRFLHLDGILVHEASVAVYVVDLAHLRQLAESAGEVADDLVLERHQFLQVDFRRLEFDAPLFRLLGFLDQLGDVQQGLGGNAAAVQAHAAGVFLGVDQRHVHAVVGREKGCRISAWSTAKHNKFNRFAHPLCIRLRLLRSTTGGVRTTEERKRCTKMWVCKQQVSLGQRAGSAAGSVHVRSHGRAAAARCRPGPRAGSPCGRRV